MAGSCKRRGALVFALWWASVVACFTQLRSVKLHSLRVDVGEANVFWAAVQKAARWNETDAETLLGKIVDLGFRV